MPKHGKRYRESSKRYDKEATYSPSEAVELVRTFANAKFDETVDVAFKLGIDPRQADQIVRGTVSLPHGTGQSIRVAVFAQADKAREAEAAGADVVGGKELAEEIAEGRDLDFDIAIATPDMMADVGKLGRVLGPRGLMPNPKTGTANFGSVATELQRVRPASAKGRFFRSVSISSTMGPGVKVDPGLLDDLIAELR